MKKLQPMAADEQATLKTSVEGEIATVVFSVKPNGEKGTPRYNLTQHFDFADVSQAELLALATRSLRIDVQAIWRKAKDRMDAEVWQGKKWQVRAMLDQTRQKADPATKVLREAAKMSKAERNALMELIAKM